MWIVYIYNWIVGVGISAMVIDNACIIINLYKSRKDIIYSWMPFSQTMIHDAAYGKG